MSNALTTQTKSLLDKMLLFNIKLVTHAIVGRIKDRLNGLVSLYIFYSSACTKKITLDARIQLHHGCMRKSWTKSC